MKLTVLNSGEDKAPTIEVSECIWDVPMNNALLHQVIVAQQANLRQGTHESLDRSDVSYSTRKLHPQKQGGRARLGSRSSPSMVGGAVAHGPHSRNYRHRLPTKMRRQALFVALSDKLREEKVKVIQQLDIADGKTKQLMDILDNFGVQKSVLLITHENDQNVMLAAHNIAFLSVLPAYQINPLQATKARKIIITLKAVEAMEALWGSHELAGKLKK